MKRFVRPAFLPAVAAALLLGLAAGRAQTPAPAPANPPASPPPAATTPAQTPPAAPAPSAPAASTPAPSAPATAASPAEPAAPPAPGAAPPSSASSPGSGPATATPAPAPSPVPPVQTADPFGEEQTLTPRKVVALKGAANWDTAFETLVASFKTLNAFLERQGIKPAGPCIVVYTSTDDTGFSFQAEIPVDQDPRSLGKDMAVTQSPEGRTLKFVHRGSYDNMDNTYEAITNYLDDKRLEAKDTFIEEYVTDPLKTAEDKLVINVYVPLK